MRTSVNAPRLARSAATLLLALLAAAAVVSAALKTAAVPLGLGDYMAIWGLKARALHRTGSLAALFRVDPAGAFSHPEYPPLWPLLLAGLARLEGCYDEAALALLAPLLHAGAAVLAFAATRASLPFRMLAAAAVALLPYFAEPLYAGYAERLLLVLLLGALALLPRLETAPGESSGLVTPPRTARAGFPALLAFGVLLTLAALTKQEGALAALVAAGAFAAARRKGPALAALGAFLAGVGPWALVVRALAPVAPPRDFALSAFDPAKLLAAGRALTVEAFTPRAPWLLGAAVLLFLAPRTAARRRGLLLAGGAYAGLLFAAFAFTRLPPGWHVHYSWDRLALVPVAAWLVVLAEAAEEAGA